MTLDEDYRKSAARRRDKAIAVILRAKESDCDPYLPPDVQQSFRKLILDQLNEFFDVLMDLTQFAGSEPMYNDLYLKRRVDEIYDMLEELGENVGSSRQDP